jgi:hypothetical protein
VTSAIDYTEEIRLSAESIILKSTSEFEEKFGKYPSFSDKELVNSIHFELIYVITGRIDTNEIVTVSPLRFYLLESMLKTGLNIGRFNSSVEILWENIKNFVRSFANYDINLFNKIKTYGELLTKAITELSFFKLSPSVDILQKIPQYQNSTQKYRVRLKDSDESNQKIFTLFPKSRYWEYHIKLDEDLQYNPFYYNRVTASLGLNKYKLSIDYDSLIVYDNKLYKLNPNVSSPNKDVFKEEEWTEFASRKFNKSRSFRSIYDTKIKELYTEFLNNNVSVNEIISDSELSKYKDNVPIIDSILPFTFGGEGKPLMEELYRLNVLGSYFGGYEGSTIGGMEYISKYTEYLFSCAYGRNIGDIYDSLDGKTLFGDFDKLFDSKKSKDTIAGLSFLNGFSKLKSFSHGQTVEEVTDTTTVILLNPVYYKFRSGINDTYISSDSLKPYFISPNVDLLLYIIENLYDRCLFIGDRVESILNSLDDKGILKGYEGLGNIQAQAVLLQNTFPPSRFIKLDPRSKNAGGLTGSIKYALDSYSRFARFVINPEFPAEPLNNIKKWILAIFNSIESVVKILEKLGFSNKLIPNISTRGFQINDSSLISYLRSLGFRDSEINSVISADSFTQLISTFAPISDSQDLKSFFKAYELAQLIYEFSGDEGISTYLNYLYSQDNVESLINILNLAQKNISKNTSINIVKYPKLIGLLIGFTYAIDPQNLIKFTSILKNNNLTLFESIQYLFDSNKENIIKDPSDIDLLEPVVKQIIQGRYIGENSYLSQDLNYSITNELAPIALKQWADLLGKNLGQIESKDIIKNLYDKSIGLTPKELLTILNNPKSVGTFSSLIDGFSGGELTKFLKYAAISGLGIKLGYYRNSSQLNNFSLEKVGDTGVFFEIINDFNKVLNLSNILSYVLDSNMNYSVSISVSTRAFVESFVSIQNRDMETFAQVFSSIAINRGSSQLFTSPSFRDFISNRPLIESPGIGNSRLPNRSPVINSITPEQFNVLFSSSQNQAQSVIRSSIGYESVINKFIKFTEDNKLISGINNPNELSYRLFGTQDIINQIDQKINEYESPKELPSLEYELLRIYSDKADEEIISPALGVFYITDNDYLTGISDEQILRGLLNPFDATESCIKFNGTDCSQYENTYKCSKLLNKSFFPETYSDVPGRDPNSLVIDRPLGTFAKYSPSGEFVPSSSFEKPPAYFSLLPEGTLPGRKNEPITPSPFSEANLSGGSSGDISEFMNTEYGLIQAVKNKLEKNNEFGCASFSSPHEYQVCMNIMKCKRFSSPTSGKYYLDFCPTYFSGGRNK